jgi:DNA segregation ATPase FtsK/SpoIIIE-like protein
MYIDEMLNGDDDSCKGDAQVVAQGSTGILQKELHQNQITELLQILAQYSGTGAVDNNAISLLLREFLRARGYNPDDYVKDPNKARQLAQQANVPPPQQGATPGQQMPPQPTSNVPPKALTKRKKGATTQPQLLLDNTPAPPVLGKQSIARPGPDIQARVPANA